MTDDNEFTEREVDQPLVAMAMFTSVRYDGSNPPDLELTIDVQHAGTDHQWRTSIEFTREQMIELTSLLVYACKQAGVDPNLEAEP